MARYVSTNKTTGWIRVRLVPHWPQPEPVETDVYVDDERERTETRPRPRA